MLIYFRQESEPKYSHFLFLDGVCLKLGKLHECEVQSVYNLVAMQLVHNIIVMYKLIGIFLHESLVDKVERVDRLKKLIFALLV